MKAIRLSLVVVLLCAAVPATAQSETDIKILKQLENLNAEVKLLREEIARQKKSAVMVTGVEWRFTPASNMQEAANRRATSACREIDYRAGVATTFERRGVESSIRGFVCFD